MPASRNRSFHEIATPGLALLINRGWVDETPEIQAAWKRFDADRNAADFRTLIEFYAPKVLHEAWRMKKRSPHLYRDEIQEMIADGLIGLMRYIAKIPADAGMPSRIFFMHKKIRHAIAHAAMARRKAAGDLKSLDDSPPNGLRPWNQSVTAERFMDGEFRNSGTNEPFQPLLNSELRRLLMRGMDSIDRKLIRRLLWGDDASEIAREFGVSRQRMHQRINGLVWTLSQRADLMNYLGIERTRMTLPARNKLYKVFKPENSPAVGETARHSRGNARALHRDMHAVQKPGRILRAG